MNLTKEYRIKQRLTPKELAKLVGCSQVYIHKLESGERTPSVTVAKKIAKELGFDWVLFFEDEKENRKTG